MGSNIPVPSNGALTPMERSAGTKVDVPQSSLNFGRDRTTSLGHSPSKTWESGVDSSPSAAFVIAPGDGSDGNTRRAQYSSGEGGLPSDSATGASP
mmetsp:Transcript_26291/g.53892  ORF Transcript_26291/g.53892 Transcript_26291/m.53892 type:complete len:96 (-) Transcript_26291:848-1135(-)